MNLMNGELKGGTFTGENVSISGLKGPEGPITLGFRAEDAEVVEAGGNINAPAYTMELLGDATMVALRAGGELINVKAHKEYRAEIGAEISVKISPEICHLFEHETGTRIEG